MTDTSDAFQSMPAPPKLASPVTAISNPTVSAPDPRTGQVKRGRGRPPGSANKVKPVEGGINPPSKMVTPAPPKPKTSDPVDTAEAKKEAKKARAEEYATYINKELNDKLFMLIIGLSNGAIPASVLFKEGKIPAKAAGNPDYTEAGNAIAIPADVADSWGKLLAELTETNMGSSIAKVADNHSLAILIAAGSALYSTFRYYKQLEPTIAMLRAIQQTQEKDNNE